MSAYRLYMVFLSPLIWQMFRSAAVRRIFIGFCLCWMSNVLPLGHGRQLQTKSLTTSWKRGPYGCLYCKFLKLFWQKTEPELLLQNVASKLLWIAIQVKVLSQHSANSFVLKMKVQKVQPQGWAPGVSTLHESSACIFPWRQALRLQA